MSPLTASGTGSRVKLSSPMAAAAAPPAPPGPGAAARLSLSIGGSTFRTAAAPQPPAPHRGTEAAEGTRVGSRGPPSPAAAAQPSPWRPLRPCSHSCGDGEPLIGSGWVAGGMGGRRDGWPAGRCAWLPTPELVAVLCHRPHSHVWAGGCAAGFTPQHGFVRH